MYWTARLFASTRDVHDGDQRREDLLSAEKKNSVKVERKKGRKVERKNGRKEEL